MMTKGLFVCAGGLALVLLVSHVAGFREFTSVLSGTYPATGAPVFWGLIYATTHMAFFLVAPILVVGAGILSFLERFVIVGTRRGGRS
jgi:hypothetical protein